MKKRILVLGLVVFSLVLTVFLSACSVGGDAHNDPDIVESINNGISERKIIYKVSFTIEQKEIEEAIKLIEESLNDDEWFDYVSKNNNYASYTIRVKTDRLDQYLTQLFEKVGKDNVYYYTKSATDVSLTYNSFNHRIEALETERDRLLALMSAENTTIQDLITINARLSEVEYQLASINTDLMTLDSTIDYSTIEVRVNKTSYAWIWVLSAVAVILIGGATLLTVLLIRQGKKNSAYKNNFQTNK